MSGELKPCPVCGNRAFLSITGVPGHRSVWCLTDGCLRMAPRETAEEAAAAWNTRAELSSLRGEGEEAWERLKARCCSDPTKASQCVMVSKANFLAAIARPTPDSDVIGRLVGALEKIATVDMGGGFLGAQACRKVAAQALASLPDTVLPRPRRNASPSEVKTGRQGIGEV